VTGWATTDRVDNDLWLCALYPAYSFMDRSTTPSKLGPEREAATARAQEVFTEVEDLLMPRRDHLGRPLRTVFLDDLYDLFYRSFEQDLNPDAPLRFVGSRRHSLFLQEDLLLVSRCADQGWMTSMFESVDQVNAIIADADVVVMRYGALEGSEDTAIRGRRCKVFWEQADAWQVEGSVELGDGTEIRVFGKR
jgi:hypothetical protein